jgi:hypothetical protein
VGTDKTDFDQAADPNDVGGPGETLRPMEALDSDDVRNKDGDEVVDPPEHWYEADKWGVTPREMRLGEPLDYKLAAEEPEPPVEIPREETRPDDGTEYFSDDQLDHVDPDHHGVDRLDIDGTPEDGDALFPVVD